MLELSKLTAPKNLALSLQNGLLDLGETAKLCDLLMKL